jgi:CheY-like chemotaxis protein
MDKQQISSIADSIDAWVGKSILVVEDVASNYHFLAATLSKSGARLTWVKAGEEAVELVKSGHHFDLVLMDVQLTGYDGYHTTGIIKSLKPELPIIAQTAFAMLGEKEKSILAGCDEYLSKPIKPITLLQTIGKYLSR